MLIEHLLFEDEGQWTKLTLEALVSHMPEHFKKVSVNAAGVAKLYVAHS